MKLLLVNLCLVATALVLNAGEPLPELAFDFIGNYCLDCHDADTEKGEINLDVRRVDWTDTWGFTNIM
ncbi:MAG: hypothetical protein ACI9TH_003878 [Kiritimatiellia bacterium]|jgi:hypothetical protein